MHIPASPLVQRLGAAVIGAAVAGMLYGMYALVSPHVLALLPSAPPDHVQVTDEERQARIDRVIGQAREILEKKGL